MNRSRRYPAAWLAGACAATVLCLVPPAGAQQAAGHAAMPGMAAGAAAKELMQAMQKMDEGMAAAPQTGDTDRDFVAMMIPHHQGAIDMAKVELSHGKDPTLRRLARNIVRAQQREIAEMKAWQRRHAAAAK